MREAHGLQRAIFSILIIALFIGQLIFPAKIAYAQVGEVPVNSIQGNVINTATKVSTAKTLIESTLQTAKSFAMHFKEFVGDSLATMVAKTVLRTITQSTVNWINSGFKGSPAFVTNPEGFLADITDQVVGQTIEELVPFVCSPFRLDIRIALGLNFSFNTQREIHCRLSDVIANVSGAYNAFVGGDFGAGGWSSWIAITGSPQNNPYGAYLSTVSAINARMVNAAGQEIKLLDWGKGFMSWRECEVPGNPYTPVKKDGTPRTVDGKSLADGGVPLVRYGPCQKKGPIKTPGSVIESSLKSAFDSDLMGLAVADEINEVFAALVNQLIKQVFTSTGLAGVSDRNVNQYAYSGTVDTGQVQTNDVLINSRQIGTELASRNTPQDFDDIVKTKYDAEKQTDLISGGIRAKIDAEVTNTDFQYGLDSGSIYTPITRTGNIALYKTARQSSTYKEAYFEGSAQNAVDGSEGGYSLSFTYDTPDPWWEVDLNTDPNQYNRYTIEEIREVQILPHPTWGTAGKDIYLFISSEPFDADDRPQDVTKTQNNNKAIFYSSGPLKAVNEQIFVKNIPKTVKGPYIRVQMGQSGYLVLREVRVFGSETTRNAGPSLALNKKAIQSTTESGKGPELAVDDGTVSSFSATQNGQNQWWEADLSEGQDKNRYQIEQITRIDVSPRFPIPLKIQDYVVFSEEPFTNISVIKGGTPLTPSALASRICAELPTPGIRSYRISYYADNNMGTVLPSIAERTWHLRIQRCNKSAADAPLKLQDVIAFGKQRALLPGATPVLPLPLFTIAYGAANGEDITNGEKLLNNPADILSDLFISASENQTNLRIGVKFQSILGTPPETKNEVFSAFFASFFVNAQSNQLNWRDLLTTPDFVMTDGCSNGLTRCMNSQEITSAYTVNLKNAEKPIVFLPAYSLYAGDTLKIRLNGEFPKNDIGLQAIPNGDYKIILQIFKGDSAIPTASATISFTE